MLREINVHKHERVLEVGAGSGYMAALLAHRAQHVTTLEIVPELAQLAAANLKRAAVLNAAMRQGDSSRGPAGRGAVRRHRAVRLGGRGAAACSASSKVGRLIAIVGQQPMMRCTLVTRSGEHAYASVDLFDTVAQRSCRASTSPRSSSSDPISPRAPQGHPPCPPAPHRLRAAALALAGLAFGGSARAQSLQEVYEAARAVTTPASWRRAPCSIRRSTAPSRPRR